MNLGFDPPTANSTLFCLRNLLVHDFTCHYPRANDTQTQIFCGGGRVQTEMKFFFSEKENQMVHFVV